MPLFGYGAFVTAAVNFLIVAFIIFLLVRAVNRMLPKPEGSGDRRTRRRDAAARDPRRAEEEEPGLESFSASLSRHLPAPARPP